MKEQCGGHMSHFQDLLYTGTRRPKTAVWKIPSNDIRRENFSKSAPGCETLSKQQLVTPRLSSSSSFRTGQLSSASLLKLSSSSCPGCATLSRMQLSQASSSQATTVKHGHSSELDPSFHASVINLENSTPSNIPAAPAPSTTESRTTAEETAASASTSTARILGSGGKLPHIPLSHHNHELPRLSTMDGSLPSPSSKQSTKSWVQAEQSTTDMKAPWYITVLKEKERFLLTLGEEVTRLTKVEAESARKDRIIAELQQEVHRLKSHLFHNMTEETTREKRRSVAPRAEEECRDDATAGESQSERSSHGDIGDSVPDLSHRLSQYHPSPDRGSEAQLPVSSEGSEGESDSFLPPSQESSENQSSSSRPSTGGGDTASEASGKGTQTEKDQVLAELETLQELSIQMSVELEKVKKDYTLCTGVISSLQKHCSFQESQLRKAEADYAKLQKEFKERGLQLEAMSAKFSSLREERKHQEMLAAMQKEKFTLQQCIEELTLELEKRNSIIGAQKSEIHNLQAEEGTTRHRLTTTQSDRDEAQSKIEALEFTISQLKVTLEFTNSKFERFRSKIVQATYSTPGTKSPQGELTDDELLEVMQKVILDRSDFYTLLVQNGVQLNPLSLADTPLSTAISRAAPSPAISKLAPSPTISRAAPSPAISKVGATPAMSRISGAKRKGAGTVA